jgi:hypothetical protein
VSTKSFVYESWLELAASPDFGIFSTLHPLTFDPVDDDAHSTRLSARAGGRVPRTRLRRPRAAGSHSREGFLSRHRDASRACIRRFPYATNRDRGHGRREGCVGEHWRTETWRFH